MKHSVHFVLCLLILAACALVASAQDATIVGTVTDPTGATVPKIAITITNTDTGVVRKLTSNEAGQYVVPDLRIGHYTVRAEASGFKTAEQRDVVLNVGERARVDFKLELGSTSESINVEATAVQVQSETGEVSEVISGQQWPQSLFAGAAHPWRLRQHVRFPAAHSGRRRCRRRLQRHAAEP